MGYFERPRDANASAVADALDISPSTFAEHLATAQRKLLEETLAEN
jgi:predicted DNA binding protein